MVLKHAHAFIRRQKSVLLFKCNYKLLTKKKAFYRSTNAIFGRLGRLAS